MDSLSDHNGYLLGTTTVFAGIIAGQLDTMLIIRSTPFSWPWKAVEPNWWLQSSWRWGCY